MSNLNDNIQIKIFASPEAYRDYDSRDEEQIATIVREQVLPREKADYHSVSVKVKRKEDGTPRYLIAYLLRKDTYTADVVRVEVDENYEVKAFDDNYTDTDEDDEDEGIEDDEGTYSEPYNFIAATPVPEISTAKDAVEAIHRMATRAGLKSKVLLGPDASVVNYKRYLRSGLMGFVNIGHGNPNAIVLDDGILSANWFRRLPGMPLGPAVVYFNSCQVFNNPLQPDVMRAGARTYIGGIVNLRIGPSEKVCQCFWDKALLQSTTMGKAMKDCEKANYPTLGAHGISGDLGRFNFISSAIDKYKVVLYGEDANPGDLVAFIHCFQNNKNVMTCEFYRDGSALPQNRYKGNRVGLVFPWSRFSAVMDVLRNEKPLYFGFIFSTKVGYISTHQEPVGEGSDQT